MNDEKPATRCERFVELMRQIRGIEAWVWGCASLALVFGLTLGSVLTWATEPSRPPMPLQCPAPRQPSCDGIRRLLENESRMCHEDLSSCRARATSCEDRLNAEPVEEHVFPRRGQH